MEHWGPGVTHWAAGDKYYAVMVDESGGQIPTFLTAALKEITSYSQLDYSSHQVLSRPTVLVRCDENGVAIDADTSTPAVELITEFTADPGTSAVDALTQAGYKVVTK